MRMMIVIAEIELLSVSLSLLSLSDYRFARRETEWQAFSCKCMCMHLFVISLVIFPFRHPFSSSSFWSIYILEMFVRMQLQMYIESIHFGDDEKKMSGER